MRPHNNFIPTYLLAYNKVTMYAVYMRNQTRDTKGKFTKNKSTYIFWIVMAIIAGYVGFQVYVGNAPVTSQNAPESTIAPQVEQSTDLNENDAKKVEIYKKKVILERKKSDELKRHEDTMKEIEIGLEAIRGEELSFK